MTLYKIASNVPVLGLKITNKTTVKGGLLKIQHAKSLSTFRTLRLPTKQKELRTLEDLAELKSLDDVDPQLIRKLINEKTSELNMKNEMNFLKQMQIEQDNNQSVPLKQYNRAIWVFLLMSSSFYLMFHLVWWKLEYNEKELKLKQESEELEHELQSILNEKEEQKSNIIPNNKDVTKQKPWYKIW
ncbi:hypothetical protein TPHA_0I01720 [Tetrapisispora phaffii CBS 4417]|uniref:Inner membrane assembly complex subunit 17 n=1 Tax=Tetrapisispora phaffii (strain ATCC 24235 / CBS 4417 / NBRC 1672 / NRRL Y-8282 / UCD 70-5) TaxID=1071381 RepID=G8BXP8_TETPH|nr:hypothetical protein TPHA_0I01720 [Tetrapisispora phaffii CBS 4417]CCE64676.1 hypothetical protein TPHA_0I01720 [Tetrapisispora phaffii CBS 4417]